MGTCNISAVKAMAARVALGQALAFLMSVTGVSTTKLVENNASYSVLQSVTAYLFILMVYGPLYLFVRYKYRGTKFADFSFLDRWYKYAVLAIVDLEANFCVVLAYQYTDMLSVQLISCFTVPCVLVLSFFVLKMKFALTHIIGCVLAIGGLCFLVALDADGLSRNVSGRNEVLGDMLSLISSALYATSNVLTEWFIKPPKTQVLMSPVPNEAVDNEPHHACHTDKPVEHRCRLAAEDERYLTPSIGDVSDDAGDDIPSVPSYVPVVENLAMMSLFALVFATIQFFIVEWKTFKQHRNEWNGEDWLFQIVFGLTMLCVYTGMPTLFLVTSAAFANISLLASNIYSIIWNVTIFHIYPTKLFFVSYVLIIAGVLLYNLTDVIKIPWCSRFNYPCGEIIADDKPQQHDTCEGETYEMENRIDSTRE